MIECWFLWVGNMIQCVLTVVNLEGPDPSSLIPYLNIVLFNYINVYSHESTSYILYVHWVFWIQLFNSDLRIVILSSSRIQWFNQIWNWYKLYIKSTVHNFDGVLILYCYSVWQNCLKQLLVLESNRILTISGYLLGTSDFPRSFGQTSTSIVMTLGRRKLLLKFRHLVNILTTIGFRMQITL